MTAQVTAERNGHATNEQLARNHWQPGMTGPELAAASGMKARTADWWAKKLRTERNGHATASQAPAQRRSQRPAQPRTQQPATRWALLWRNHDPVAYVLLGVAGAVSYHHIVQLALLAGADWWAWVLPLSLDGMMLAAGRRQAADRKAKRKAHRPAAVALGLGAVLSLACNAGAVLARVRPELVPLDWVLVALALVPPLAVLMYVQLTDRGRRR